jgi:aspartate aminotransferase
VLYLLEDAGVAVVSGSAYGLSPYFRMSIAANIEIIAEGCRKIAEVVAALA